MAFPQGTAVQDWIQDFFSPVLSVLASEDAEAVTAKNNLSVAELLQPFSKILASADLGITDADGSKTFPTSLNIVLQDFKKDVSRLITQKVMLDRVSEENCRDSDLVTHNFEKLSIDIPGSTPWFDVWMKHYLHSLPVSEYEYLKHLFGCIFVVSSNCNGSPVEKLRGLVETQHRHQHEQKSANYFAPNIIKCFVLLHDSSGSVSESDAQAQFGHMQSAFGPQVCHFLKINSRDPSESESGDHKSYLAQYWLSFSHRFFSTELRRNISDLSPNNNSEFNFQPQQQQQQQNSVGGKDGKTTLEHPLAINEMPESPLVLLQPAVRLTKATADTVAALLTDSDVGRIQLVVRDIVGKSVIPFAEKQIKSLHEIASNKKSRGLFAGAKRWFGNQKGMTGAIASIGYARDAPELQVRRLADVYFLMNMYKSAYTHYYSVKKDFQQDEAWTYYAPAVEMAALSLFMMNYGNSANQEKKYRADYMEDAVAKYLTVCQSPEFAVRATLFDALCLKHQGLYVESANSYIKMTNELSDLRSAMLLEQAAYCYLQAPVASLRKYGFHIVLSGYRFTKTASCKEHAVRLYIQGSQVYDRKGWLLSSENILYTLGHQKFMLKDFSTSAEYFNSLMAVSTGRNHLQQMVHLREYFLVFHARFKENKNIVPLTIPKLMVQEVEVTLGDVSSNHKQVCQVGEGVSWHDVEKCVLNGIKKQEVFVLSQTCQQHFSSLTHNNLNPQAVVGETIHVSIPFENNFPVGLQLKNLSLIWKFTNQSGETFSNEKPDSEPAFREVKTRPIDTCTLEANSKSTLELRLSCECPGVINIVGVEYMLRPLFPDREPTDHQIRGKQYIQITGPKLNTVQDHKTRIVDGQDNRLNICVREPQPRLEAKLKSPAMLFDGELKCVELVLTNSSKIPLKNLHLVCTRPGLLSFGKTRANSLFELPLIAKPDSPYAVPTVSEPVKDYMDLMPVPLPDQLSGKLAAGSTISLPLWIRGQSGSKPPVLGPTATSSINVRQLEQVTEVNECLYFYYENSESEAKFNHRILSVPVTWRLQPSLEVRGNLVGDSVVEGSKCLKHLELNFRNQGKAGTEGYLEEIMITQVSLLSKENQLESLEMPDCTGSILPDQTLSLALKTCCDTPPGDKENINKRSRKSDQQQPVIDETLRFSSVGLKENKCHSINSPPFIDFLKSNFDFGIPKKPPSLKGDIAVIMWRCNSSQPVLGQTFVQIDPGSPPDLGSSLSHSHTSAAAAGSPDRSRPEDAEAIPGLIRPVPFQPVRLEVEHPNKIRHDFSQRPFLSVGITLKFSDLQYKLASSSSSDGDEPKFTLVQYRINNNYTGAGERNPVAGQVWSGASSGATCLAAVPDSRKGSEPESFSSSASVAVVQLNLNVQEYGLYSVRSVEYRARRSRSKDLGHILNCDLEFSPLELCFTVLPPC